MTPSTDNRPRYRKISTRLYADEKFRQLSKPKPNAQTLWFFLITGPFTINVPGLLIAGPAALAEALGWPLAAFRRAWCEIESAGMGKADWAARVVWLPNAVKHNPPANQSVARGWRNALADVPECTLKLEAIGHLEAVLAKLGDQFAAAFRETDQDADGDPDDSDAPLPLALDRAPHSVPHGVADRAEQQDQDQDQDQKKEHGRAERTPLPTREVFEHYERRFIARYGAKPEYAARKDAGRLARLLKAHGLDEVRRRLDAFFASPDPWVQGSGHTLDVFCAAGTQTKLVAQLSPWRREGPRAPGDRYVPSVDETRAYLDSLDAPVAGEVA